jgi:predicted O-methyltransferase YrrM
MPHSVDETILDSPNANHDGNVSPRELRTICKLIRHFKPANLFEIGTFEGHTTAHMAANAPKTSRIFTLDLPAREIDHTALRIKTSDSTFILKEQSGREFVSDEGLANKITQLYGDSANFDFTDYDNKMDFVFVDGSHSYEYAKNDTKVALKLLRNTKGIIIWHDYGWREVVRALNELYLELPSMGSARHIKDTSLVIYNSNSTNSGRAK